MRLIGVLLATIALGCACLAPAASAGTKVSLRDSEYGRMLWGPGPQAVYVFETEEDGEPRCYTRCAKAWPPMLTEGRPRAGAGVDETLLGTTRRRNGDRQVTYAGRPLYYYEHEGRNEVLCHNVHLNGGWWWAVGRDGVPLP